MRKLTVLVTTAMLLMSLNARSALAQDERAAEARIDALVKSSAAGGVERIDIFRLPKGYENIASIQPDDLEALWHCRMTIRELLPSKQQLISRTLRTANIHHSDRTWDLRWGIVFYWPKDRRIAALYFDETGRYGSVDKVPVSFGINFFLRLKNALHLSLE